MKQFSKVTTEQLERMVETADVESGYYQKMSDELLRRYKRKRIIAGLRIS